LTSSREQRVREAYEAECRQQAEVARSNRERADRYERVVVWCVAIGFTLMVLAALYVTFPIGLQILADYQAGWLTLGLFLGLIIPMYVLPLVLLAVLIKWAWSNRRSD